MSGTNNLIMGLWSRGGLDGLEKFIFSLRRTTFRGDVCVFVEQVSPETVAGLQSHGIVVERADRLTVPPMHNQSSRYFTYLEFLTRCGAAYDNVMISDLRDVVFQSDPFAQPLPADIVFAQERCLIGEEAVNRNWISSVYGEAIAHNLRDFPVSCSGTTFASTSGMLRYLVAMTTELASLTGRGALAERGIDQGIHNYVIRMCALRDAWLDPTDSLVATMHFVPDASVGIAPDAVLIDGKVAPVLHQWDRNKITRDHVLQSPRFRREAPHRPAPKPAQAVRPAAEPHAPRPEHAVLAYYHRPRDAGWLAAFLGSLRCAGYAGRVHCVGAFEQDDLALLARQDAVAHQVDPTDPSLDAENIAHLFLSRVLDELARDAETTRPDQVVVLDTVRAGFLRDPFQAATIGLSMFHESATRIGESEFNLQRLGFFATPDDAMLRRPVVSSALLRGRLDLVRAFYRRLFAEFVGRAELLRIHKSIQGAVNKLCHGGGLGMPVIQHPNGAEAYFQIWEEGLPTRLEPPIRIAGAVPFVVLNPVRETELMHALRASLGIEINGGAGTPTMQ